MQKIFLSVIGIIISIYPTSSFSKTTDLKGKIMDAETGLPLKNIHVLIHELQREAISDSGGFFSFTSVEAGTYHLSFANPAYARYEKEVRTDDTLIIRLDPVVFHGPEVIVTSTKGEVPSSPVPTIVVDGMMLPQTGAPTVSDILSQQPGVALVRDGMWETDVSIRGMTRNNVVMMVDNTRLETANDIATALSLINPFDLDRIEVIKGANSALAGTGAFGGVVNCISKSPSYSDQPRFDGESLIQYESVNHSSAEYLALESGSENFKLRGSGEYRKAGNYETPLGDVPNSQYNDFGLTGDAGIKLFNNHSLDLTYQRFQAEDTGIPGDSLFTQTASAKYTLARRELYKLEYSIPDISDAFPVLILRASRQIIERHVQVIQTPTLTLTPHAIHGTDMFQIEGSIVPATGHFLTAGVEVWQRTLDSKRERYNYSNNTVIQDVPLPNSSFGSAGIYAQDEWQLIPQATIVVLGGRCDFIRVHNDLTVDTVWIQNSSGQKTFPQDENVLWPENTSSSASWSANLGIDQKIYESLNGSVLLSTAFRSPSLEERYQYLNFGGSIHVGNPDLQPEQSVSINCGLEWRTLLLRLDGDVYYNSLRDLVSEVLGTFEGNPAYVKINIGQARMYGYELSAETDAASHLIFGATLSYVRGENTKSHANLPQIPPLHAAFSANYMFGNLGTIDAQLEGDARQDFSAVGENPPAGYILIDAGYRSVPVAFSGIFITLNLGVHNLFNRAYMNFLSTARGEIKYEPGRNIFATASVQW
ncbi:MAG TPA: TonB-dependent receptor [Candidatus Acidoferrales bacterium]|nr:TonB-dependent receptor [Candidatus Acidoferrales bacterium]